MKYTKLKKVLISSLLSGSIMLSVGTVAANSSNFGNVKYCAQYGIELLQDDPKANQENILKPKMHKSGEKFSNALNSFCLSSN